MNLSLSDLIVWEVNPINNCFRLIPYMTQIPRTLVRVFCSRYRIKYIESIIHRIYKNLMYLCHRNKKHTVFSFFDYKSEMGHIHEDGFSKKPF